MPASAFHLKLPDDLRADVEAEIIRNIRTAVDAAKDRDELLRQYNEQIDGLMGQSSRPPGWKNSATVDDPLTLKGLIFAHAQGIPILKRDPKWLVEPVDPDDKKNAEVQEAFLQSKGAQINLASNLSDAWYNAIRYPVAVMYVGWVEKMRRVRAVEVRNPVDGTISENEPDGAGEWEEVYTETIEPVYVGPELRVTDTADFYTYPFATRGVQQATAVGERLYLTKHDLYSGIEDYAYDEDVVLDILASGPDVRPDSAQAEHVQDQWGGENEDPAYYECFLWYTKMPLLMDERGKIRTPEYLRHAELECVVCLKKDSEGVLRMDFSPYSRRPYVTFNFDNEPGSLYTRCLPSMLDALQCEANANIRSTIDGLNLMTTPFFKGKRSTIDKWKTFDIGPGKIVPFEESPNEIEQFQCQLQVREGLELQSTLDQRAEGLYSAGLGNVGSKVRKAAEMQQMMMVASTLIDRNMTNFQRGMEEVLAPWLIAICQENMDDDTMEEFTDEEGQPHKIGVEQLKGRYIYKAVSNAQNANPDTRIQMAKAAKDATLEYIMAKAKGLQGPDLVALWEAERAFLIDLGVHDPERLLGERPAAPEGQQVMPQQPQMMMNGTGGNGNGTGHAGVPLLAGGGGLGGPQG